MILSARRCDFFRSLSHFYALCVSFIQLHEYLIHMLLFVFFVLFYHCDISFDECFYTKQMTDFPKTSMEIILYAVYIKKSETLEVSWGSLFCLKKF